MTLPKMHKYNGTQVFELTPDFILSVALGKIDGCYGLQKFGANPGIGNAPVTYPQDVWTGGPETYAADGGKYTFSTEADIDSISSSDNSDTQDILVIGLDENWNQVSQIATLQGQTRVALTTPLIRVYRFYNIGTTDFAGNIYVYVNGDITDGVPDDKTTIRAKVIDGANQTEMAIYTVPAGYSALFLQGYVGITNNKTGQAEFTYAIRPYGGVFLTKGRISNNTVGSGYWKYDYKIPPLVPEKADVKISCVEVSANDIAVVAGFDMILFDNEKWSL